QDNYNKVLPVFEYVAADNPKAVAGNLDNAIEKVTIVKALHEVSDWVDDCYLLMGKAQFVKQDYESAEETLEYLRAEYNPEAMAKKARKGKKTKKGKKKKKKKSVSKKKKSSKKKKKSSAKSRKKKRKAANKAAKKRKKDGSKKKKSSSSKKKTSTKEKTKEDTSDASEKRKKKKSKTSEDAAKQGSANNDDQLKLSEADAKGAKAGLLKRPPAFQEGQLWLARTYIERENYDEAQEILNSLAGDPNTLTTVKQELPPVMAHYYIKQKQYESAIRPLEQAISSAKKKQDKARYAYILAQIHQMGGRGEESYAFYEKAGSWSNSYEMRFSSKLNMVKNDYVNGRATADQVTKDLEKMAKDIKNEEYRDQIYYALADIALKRDKKPEAIAYLKQSLNFSTGNTAQSAEAYFLLADLYFEGQDFVNAKNYFDSTLQVLPKTDERYDRVSNYSKNLTEIAANIVIIEEQDSLLTISRMSDKEKEALAYQLQQQKEQERINKLKAEANKPDDKFKGRSRAATASSRGRSGNVAPSTFFAYNDRSLKKGKKDFDKKWDDRPLDDNWRRSNRRGGGNLEEEFAVEEVPSGVLTDEDIKKLLKDVPGSEAEIKAAEEKIIDAMFALGSLYRDRLELNSKTIEILEELNNRFPGNKHELDSWYFLYLAYTDIGNSAKARFYHDKIVEKYPETTYARVLLDPNFLESSKEEERRLNTYYNQTFLSFETGKYQDVTERAVKAVELFGPANTLQPRFALLNAMSQGNIQGKDAYVKELRSIISKYPDTPEQKRAREILRLLGATSTSIEDKEKVGGENKKTKSETAFKLDDKKMHYVLVVINDKELSVNDAKNSLSDYHKEFHKLDKLRIAPVYIGTNRDAPVLVVRRFKSKALAMDYFDGVSKNQAAFLPDGTDFEVYPITQYNYRQVLKTKDLEGYKVFFKENY
ncbi:MAG: tetratricopeptide repeat protein, partial [Flavobacteriaceae bacterium]|nr:tetratricopeptide repeat protein [Flavobacteriaceae bacterium]